MPLFRLAPVFTSVLSLCCLCLPGCGDDATVPDSDVGPPTFVRMISGANDAVAGGVVVTFDGLRVMAGYFNGTAHVGGSSDSLVSAGSLDLYLAAFRPDGTVAWQKRAGGAAPDYAYAIARDGANNLYVAGLYYGDTAFGATNLTGYGDGDAFVARFDPNGNPVWAAGGGAAGLDGAFDVAVASDGEVVACGEASSEIAIAGEDLGEFGSESGFLVKIRADGVGRWAQTASGNGFAQCLAVTTTSDGHILVCGRYTDETAIGGVILGVDGGSDAFIARFTNAGVPVGVIRIGGAGSLLPYELAHIGGEPIIVGSLNGEGDFDVNSAAGGVTSKGGNDAFVARYDAAGALRWVKTFGTTNVEDGLDVCRIGSDDLLLCGRFASFITVGSTTMETYGGTDYFLARLDGSGNVKWATRLGSENSEGLGSVAAAGETAIIVGTSSAEIMFPNGEKRTAVGWDAFLFQKP